ncbi:MAG TPA: signal peptidase I [Ignavibacteria bacterium]|nr:signal peptidase I [Ignavibacteria bacterium]
MADIKDNKTNKTSNSSLDKFRNMMSSKKSGKTKKPKIVEYFNALLWAAVVAFIIKVFLFEAYRIPTGSMENTLLVGDFLLVTKFTYGATTPRNIPFTNVRLPYVKLPGFKDPQQGDVIVFDFPGDRDEVESKEVINYIKRCVAVSGDKLQIINKTLYVNGKVFTNPPESRFAKSLTPSSIQNPRIFPKGSGWNEDNYGPITVPKKGDLLEINDINFEAWKYFIMKEGNKIELRGNQVYVNDSPLPNGQYEVKRDYLFMMGDNRNNSLDSRFWGFMPVENVVGEALLIYWSWDPSISFLDFFKLIKSTRWDRVGMFIH